MNWKESQSRFLSYHSDLALSRGFFMRYYAVPTSILERMSHVNDTDVLISGADSTGRFGFEVLGRGMQHALPRIIVPDKPTNYAEGDWIYSEYEGGYRYGNFLTASLIGVGYVAFGWAGVFIFPFVFGSLVFLLIKKTVGSSLLGNVWGIFTLISVNNQFAEGGTWSYMSMILRQLPQNTFLMLLFAALLGTSRFFLRKMSET